MAHEPAASVAAAPPAIEMPPEAVYRLVLANPTIPKFYANTFGLIIQPTDLAVMLGQAGSTAAVVSMTYPVAKTLAVQLERAIANYEKLAQVSVPEAEALEKKYRETQQKP